jgi:hypothetical protein
MTPSEFLEANPFVDTDKNHILYRNHRHLFGWMQFHSYYENFYDEHFRPYYGRPGLKICEIGIQKGSSLFVLANVFPDALLLGIDVDPSWLVEEYTRVGNCVRLYTDAYDRKLAGLLGQFDIIIDDGPHTPQSQLEFVSLYYQNLAPGGTMVIEDVSSPEVALALESAAPLGTSCRTVDLRQVDDRYDSIVVHINRPW